MRSSYDFSNAKKNPYISRLKKQITIRIDTDTIEYFKSYRKAGSPDNYRKTKQSTHVRAMFQRACFSP